VWWPTSQNSYHARGENIGAPPRSGPVRGRGATELNGDGIRRSEVGACCFDSSSEETVLCAWWAGEARPPRTQNPSMHGARTSESRRGADPSAAKIRRSFTAELSLDVRQDVATRKSGKGDRFPLFPVSDCFWCVPAGTHQKLLPCTGRERRHPAKVRTRPRPRHYEMNVINGKGGRF